MSVESQEESEFFPTSSTLDAIDIAVSGSHHITNYRFDDLIIEIPAGRSPRLRVSRYYWDLQPPVVVDFVFDLKFGEMEYAVKLRYFQERGIRYALAKDPYDGEGVEAKIFTYEPEDEQAKAVRDAAKPLIGPRRKQTNRS